MGGRKLLFFSFSMCVATGCIVYWLGIQQQKKIAVVDAVKLFDGFNMKKELESHDKVKLEVINKQVDSIGNLLRMAQASKDEDATKRLSYMYEYVKAAFQNAYKQSNHDINEQVWKRLNPLVEEYGKKNKLYIIIGANGMGSVLYNAQDYDLTDDLIKYVNRNYEEGN